jgi:hypothetical protein
MELQQWGAHDGRGVKEPDGEPEDQDAGEEQDRPPPRQQRGLTCRGRLIRSPLRGERPETHLRWLCRTVFVIDSFARVGPVGRPRPQSGVTCAEPSR